MCGASEQYSKYDSCALAPPESKGFIQNVVVQLNPREDRQHLLKTTLIYLCGIARARPDQSPCTMIEDIMPGTILEAPAYSSFMGSCPACDAAADACNRTVIFNSPEPPLISGDSEEPDVGPAQIPPQTSKRHRKGQKTTSKKKSKK